MVYNLEVEDLHSYFVGCVPVLVHNYNNHGNSLKTNKTAQGYSLRDRDTGAILKYGETTLGSKRYTSKYLDSINANVFWEATGTKYEMHLWQHQKILDYIYVADVRPPLNKSLW